jgi:hypothetical protein
MNMITLTDAAKKLQERTMGIASNTLNEALEGVSATDIERAKLVLQQVYDNLK